MIGLAWHRFNRWLAHRRQRNEIRGTADTALRLLRRAGATEVITQPAGVALADAQARAMARAMVALLRLDAAERETIEASARSNASLDPGSDPLPHDLGRVDPAQRAALLRLARRIELLRSCEPG